MKTIGLRELLRNPKKVKAWTKTGRALTITEKGRPLWILQPVTTDDDSARNEFIEAEMKDLFRQPPLKISLTRALEAARE